jgi:hypothetical protein
MPKESLCFYETERRRPSYDRAHAICQALNRLGSLPALYEAVKGRPEDLLEILQVEEVVRRRR